MHNHCDGSGEVSAVLRYWLVAEVAGLAAAPICAFLFARLPGRGLGFARPLGLLLMVYPSWLLAGVHLVPYGVVSMVLGVGALVATGGYLWWRSPFRDSLYESAPARKGGRGWNWSLDLRLWLVAETLFIVGFFAWALVRSYVPMVWQTEKPMDMAFINAINRSSWFPPHDPWLSGASLNYYYFGHYLVAFLIRFSAIDPSVGFNLGVALIFGLTLSAVFTLGSTLAIAVGATGRSIRAALAGGLGSACLVLLLGNLAAGVQFLARPAPLAAYDWWSPSRVIVNTANEFPLFSFLLADLHAHVMASPFLLLSLGLGLQLATRGPRRFGTSGWLGELLLAGLAVGSLYAINSLDFPLAAGVILGALLLASTARDRRGSGLATLAWAVGWLVLSVLLYLPFWLHFVPSAGSLALLPDRAGLRQFLHDYLLIYGLALWLLAGAFAVQLGRLGLRGRLLIWNGVPAVALLVLLAPAHLDGVVILAGLVVSAGLAALMNRESQAVRFFWFLTAVSFGLILVSEVAYIRDAFAGSPFYRFNTVFKLGYQAWFLLGILAGVFALWGRQWIHPRLYPLWLAGAGVLVTVAAIYPVAGTYAREASFAASPTLSGDRWLAPGDHGAITWVRTHVRGTPVILETVGPDYDPMGRGRISTFTGLPTVLAWAGHEIQWSHPAGGRYQDVRMIYSTLDPAAAQRLLDRYQVRYVVVGPLERQDYPAGGLDKFALLGSTVFKDGGTTLYEIRP
jgi:YYY domain-containing protein